MADGPSLIAKYIFKAEGIPDIKAQAAQAGAKLQAEGRKGGKSFGTGLMSGLSNVFSPANVGKVIGVAVAGGLALSLREFAGWESQVSGAVARMGINTSEAMKAADPSQYEANLKRYEASLANVGNVSKELGATTAFTSKEVAAGMENLAAVGVNIGTMSTASMKPFLDLANATKTALPESIEIQMAAIKQFGLGVEDSGRVADVFAATTGSSAANLQDLGKAMEYVGPTAAGLGYDIETVSAYIGTLRDNGFVATKAGTGLNNMFSRLSGASPRVAKYMEEIGLSMDDVNPRANSLTDIMRKIGEASGIPADGFDLITTEMEKMEKAGMSDEEMFAALSEQGGAIGQFMKVFGLEAGPAALALLKNADAADQLAESLHAVEGVAGEVARQQLDNLSGAVTIMMSGVSGLMLQIGGLIAPYAMQLVSAITTTVIPAASQAVSGIASVFGTLSKLLSPVLTPIGALAKVAFGNFIAIGKIVYASLQPAITVIKAVASAMGAWGGILGGVISKFGDMSGPIGKFGEFSQKFNVLGQAIEVVGPMLDDAKNYAQAFIAEFMELDSVQQAIEKAKDVIIELGEKVVEVKEKAQEAWDGISDGASQLAEGVKSAFESIASMVDGVFGGLIDTVYQKLADILSPIMEIAAPFADQLGESFQGVQDFFDRVDKRANQTAMESMAEAGEVSGETFTTETAEGIVAGEGKVTDATETTMTSAGEAGGKAGGKAAGEAYTEEFIEALRSGKPQTEEELRFYNMFNTVAEGQATPKFAASEFEVEGVTTKVTWTGASNYPVSVIVGGVSLGSFKTYEDAFAAMREEHGVLLGMADPEAFRIAYLGAVAEGSRSAQLRTAAKEELIELGLSAALKVDINPYEVWGTPQHTIQKFAEYRDKIEPDLLANVYAMENNLRDEGKAGWEQAWADILDPASTEDQIEVALDALELDEYGLELVTRIRDGFDSGINEVIVDSEVALGSKMRDVGDAMGRALEDGIVSIQEQETLAALIEEFEKIGGDSSDALIQAILAGDYAAAGKLVAERFGSGIKTLFGEEVGGLLPTKSLQDMLVDPDALDQQIINLANWKEHTWTPALNDFITEASDLWDTGYIKQRELNEAYFNDLMENASKYSHWYEDWQLDLITSYEHGAMGLDEFFDRWQNKGKLSDELEDESDAWNNYGSSIDNANRALSAFGNFQETPANKMFGESLIMNTGDYINKVAEKIAGNEWVHPATEAMARMQSEQRGIDFDLLITANTSQAEDALIEFEQTVEDSESIALVGAYTQPAYDEVDEFLNWVDLMTAQVYVGAYGPGLSYVEQLGLTSQKNWGTPEWLPALAEGAHITRPTIALIGEDGDEWVLNENQMSRLVDFSTGQIKLSNSVSFDIPRAFSSLGSKIESIKQAISTMSGVESLGDIYTTSFSATLMVSPELDDYALNEMIANAEKIFEPINTITPKLNIDESGIDELFENESPELIPSVGLDQTGLTEVITKINGTASEIPVGLNSSKLWADYQTIVSKLSLYTIYIPVSVNVVADVPALISSLRAEILARLQS